MTADEQRAMWDRRDRLIEELRAKGLLPDRALYIRRQDGGAYAVAKLPNRAEALSVDWHPGACDYSVVNAPLLQIETYEQKAEGFGGMLGFGKKGGRGWMLRLLDGDTPLWEAPLLPGITAVADLLYGGDRFMNEKRKKRGVPLWQLCPENVQTCERILSAWSGLIDTVITEEQGDGRRLRKE